MTVSEAFLADYKAINSGHGYVALKGWSMVTATGADRHSFLHNMCTNEIKGLSFGESCEAFFTDVKGKVLAHVFVWVREDRLDLLTVPGQAEMLISHLDRYVIREDVVLTDSTDDCAWTFGSKGDENSRIVERFSCDAEMTSRAEAVNSHACGLEAWDAVRIEAGLPLFGIDFDSKHLPQEVNRDDLAISFNKGCYLGQETVARIDALGRVNKKIVSVRFAGPAMPTVGLTLNDTMGNKVGHVTSCCWSPKYEAPLALAWVRHASNALASQLLSDHGEAVVV